MILSEYHTIGLPVFGWTHSFKIPETLGEITRRGKSQNSRDLRLGKIRFGQKPFPFPDPAGNEIVNGRSAIFPLKGMSHIVFVDADFFRKQIQCDVFLIMMVNISLH